MLLTERNGVNGYCGMAMCKRAQGMLVPNPPDEKSPTDMPRLLLPGQGLKRQSIMVAHLRPHSSRIRSVQSQPPIPSARTCPCKGSAARAAAKHTLAVIFRMATFGDA